MLHSYLSCAIYSPIILYSTFSPSSTDLDSGGSVHGPMDQKHTTRLGNISRSGQLIPGSRYYLSDSSSQQRTMRRQSESGAWDLKSESEFRSILSSFPTDLQLITIPR